MKKRLWNLIFSVFIAIFMCLSYVVPNNTMVNAATNIGYSPYPSIEYGYTTNVKSGTIRYISQMRGLSYYYSAYWGNWESYARGECGTASVSMALSYIGVNYTPKAVLDVSYYSDYTRSYPNATSTNKIDFYQAYSNYANGNGKYSPPLIHLDNYCSAGHYIIVIAKISSNVYLVADPSNYYGETWAMTINGNTASYFGNGNNHTDYISGAYQWYNPNSYIARYDKNKTVISNIKVTQITSNGYKIECDIINDPNNEVKSVYFPTWTSKNGQDDLKWVKGLYQNKHASITISTNAHNKETGTYISHIYASANSDFDVCYQVGKADGVGIAVPSSGGVAPNSNFVLPSNMTEGDRLDFGGGLWSDITINSICIGCYNLDGSVVKEEIITPNTTGYTVSKWDLDTTDIPAGAYRFKIEAKTSKATTVVKNQCFLVRSKGRTISDGEYVIKPVGNQNMSISYDPKSNAANKKIVITTYSDQDKQRYNIKYLKDGYYIFSNVENGKGIDLHYKSKADGAEIIEYPYSESDTAQLFYIIPSNDGYVISPICAPERILDVHYATYKEGDAVVSHSYNFGANQRFIFEPVNRTIEKLEYNMDSVEVYEGKTISVSATVTPSNANDVILEYSSNDSSIATVNKTSGEITGISAGETTVNVIDTNSGISDSVKVTVNHNYVKRVIDPTCYIGGYTVFTCSTCNDSYITDELPARGHHEIIDKGINATCTSDGLTEGKHCDVCGEITKEQTTIEKYGHKYNEGEIVKEATDTESGTIKYTCVNCGASYNTSYDLPPEEEIQGKDGFFSYTAKGNIATITSYTGTEENVIVPSTVDGIPVKIIGEKSFNIISEIKTIEFSEGIQEIKPRAIYRCENLEKIILPSSFQSMETESNVSSFDDLDRLKSFDINENNSVYCSVDGIIFSKDKTKLIKYPQAKENDIYVIPDNVTQIGSSAFIEVNKVNKVVIPEGITEIPAYTFGYSDIKSVELPNSCNMICNTAFIYSKINNIYIPANISSISNESFYGCEELVSFDVDEDNKYFSSIDGVLYNKTGTKMITYPGGKTDLSFEIPNTCTEIGYGAFAENKTINEVVIPESVTKINGSVFWYCSNLAKVSIKSTKVTFGKSIFSNVNGFIIEGYKNSSSEQYANDNNYAFKEFDNADSLTGECGETATWELDSDGTLYIRGTGAVSVNTSILDNQGYKKVLKNIKKVIIEEGITEICDNFSGGQIIESVTLPSTLSKVSYNPFYKVKDIIVSENNEYFYAEDGDLYSKDKTKLYHVSSFKTGDYYVDDEVKYTEFWSFSGVNITKVIFPRNIYCIHQSTFGSSRSLREIVFKGNAPIISDAFIYGCPNAIIKYPTDSTGWDKYINSSDFSFISFESYVPVYSTEIIGAIEPTCTEEGYSGDVVATEINKIMESGNVIPALGHDYEAWTIDSEDINKITRICSRCKKIETAYVEWDSGTITKEPTCINVGEKTYYNAQYDVSRVEEIPVVDHTIVSEGGVEATCEEEGCTNTKYCKVCNKIFEESETIPAKGHDWNEEVTETATCVSTGKITKTCTACDKKEEIILEKKEHIIVTDAQIDATCTQNGLTSCTHCVVCDEVFVESEEIPALGHDYVAIENTAIEATCTTDGKEADMKCSRCDNIEEGTNIPASGHDYGELINETPATCTEDGMKAHYECSICHELFILEDNNYVEKTVEELTIPAIGHIYDQEKIDSLYLKSNADCTHSAVYFRSCICGEKGTETFEYGDALGHSFGEYYDDGNATCSKNGTSTAKCSRCDATDTIVIDGSSTGKHNWSEYEVTSQQTCFTVGIKTRYCKDCGKESSEEIPKSQHEYVEEIQKAATCLETGIKKYTCKHCGSEKYEIIPVKQHTIVVDPAVAATESSTGLTEGSHCSTCGAILTTRNIIPKLSNSTSKDDTANSTENQPSKTNPTYSNEWINGKWYDKDGKQSYDGTLQWKCNSTGWWVEDTAGWYPQDSWQKIDGKWYYFKPDGYMASAEYYNGYWFNSDGSWDEQYFLTWKSNSTGWWVEDKSGWWPSSKWLKIDGSWYYFDSSGYMVTNQYVDGYWIGANGVCS